jgi:Kef-type K+ transport system membrane component KefB
MALELTFIPALLVILLAAGAGRLLSRGIKQPVILGELILGMVLGSFIILAPAAQGPIFDIAEIGILLLLFSIGLTIDFEEFKKLEVTSSVVAAAGVILPFVFGYVAAIIFGFSHIVALLVGTSLVATSVGISASVLMESRMLRTKIGTLIMGAAVADDVIGVIMMSAFISLAVTGAIQFLDLSLLIVLAVLFFILSLTVGIKVFRKISEKITVARESLLLIGIVVVLAFGIITQEIGISAIIGAFVAGLVVGQTHYARDLRGHVSLIGGGFFIPIFFVTVGMNFNLNAFTGVGLFAAVLVILAIIGKIVGCSLGAKACRFSNRESLAVGIAMVPRAEVALIIAQIGLRQNIIGPDVVSAILVMVVITALITPPSLWKVLRGIGEKKKT